MAENNPDIADAVKPVTKICEVNVEIPTVLVKNIGPKGEETLTVCIQWLGKADQPLPENSQFLFTVFADPEDVCWMGHPEEFKVVFLGQIKDWPEKIKGTREQLADQMAGGNLNTWVVWLCSHHYHMEHDTDIGPGSFTCGITLLADPNVGVIEPQLVTNLQLLECPPECQILDYLS